MRPRRVGAPPSDDISLRVGPALAVVGAGLCIGVGGLAIVGPALAVPGLAVAALGLLAAIIVALGVRWVRVGGETLTGTVTEGQRLALAITVSRTRLLGVGLVWLEHPLLDEPLLLTRESPRRLVLSARPERRGQVPIPPPRLRLSDPCGLAQGLRTAAGGLGELLVLPRTEPVHWLDSTVSGAAVSPAWTAAAGAEAIDLAGLRDYQPGTPATRIHWPALAHGGGLLERVFDSETERVPLIVVDPRGHSGVDAAALDLVIRAVASLSLALAGQGTVDLLLPGVERAVRLSQGLSSWPSAHRALALVALAAPTGAGPQIPGKREGVLFYACTQPQFALGAQGRWRGRTLTLSPRRAAVAHPVLEVAGCVAGAAAGET